MAAQDERSVQSHSTHTPGALTGLRVIELADEQAEYCGLALAGLGAEVIKWSHPAAAPRAASVPSTKTGKIPSALCSSGSTTAASARLCLICTSRKTATSSAHSLPQPTCCWSPRPGRAGWLGVERRHADAAVSTLIVARMSAFGDYGPGPTSRAQT